ncbi:MAG: GNAT family N-acetyltransferase [Kiritimatiellae bacterium]|nr:GNAT family N-acetyltransferase [Kiritimatiellia bacterium]
MNSNIHYAISGELHSEELGQLLQSVKMNAYSDEKRNRIISGSTAYVTARDAGSLVGFGRIISDGATLAYINNMAVSPQYQRQGIGQTILETLMRIAKDVTSIYLYTNTADALYIRYGFKLSEKRLYILRNS